MTATVTKTSNTTYSQLIIDTITLNSPLLGRYVKVDFYRPKNIANNNYLSLLLINDGQDMELAGFANTLNTLTQNDAIEPLFAVGIHCSDDRRNEYGTALITDYKGRGGSAKAYQNFVLLELLPFIRNQYNIKQFREKAFAGFSMGGLSALDIVWNNAVEFTKVGVFSGSLWWRSKSSKGEAFDEDKDRIMHQQIRAGNYYPWLKFFFQCGLLDEKADRNNNGIIDSVDDTQDLMMELEKKGYNKHTAFKYLELTDGRHDVPTWGKAIPEFLKWGWGINNETMD